MKLNALTVGLVSGLITLSGSSTAATINIDRELNISGGITGSSIFIQNPGFNQRSLNTQLNDFIIDIATPISESSPISAFIGIGTINSPLVSPVAPAAQGTPITTGIQYGWFAYKKDKLNFSVGHLATKIGYESPIGYKNKQISRGLLWTVQPTYYPGGRVETKVKDIAVYGEITNAGPSRRAFAFGASGKAGNFEYSASYYDDKSGINIIDLIVNSEEKGIPYGINFDFVMNDAKTPSSIDGNAFGIAAFADLTLKNIELPVRIEYIHDGTSGLFGGVDNVITATATPTKWLDKKTFLRTEAAFASTKNKVFRDGDGKAKDFQLTLAVQVGLLF